MKNYYKVKNTPLRSSSWEQWKRERGRTGGMRDNCIRKRRRPKGRKWLEEKGLISDRKKERWRNGWVGEEGLLTTHRSIHTDTLSLCQYTNLLVCVCWCRSVNPSLPHLTCPLCIHIRFTGLGLGPCRRLQFQVVLMLMVARGFGPFQLLFTSDFEFFDLFTDGCQTIVWRPPLKSKTQFYVFILFSSLVSILLWAFSFTVYLYSPKVIWSRCVSPSINCLFFLLLVSLSPFCLSSFFPWAAYLLSLTPAPGVWALTDSLRVTGAPRQYLPGLATLRAVVGEWGRDRAGCTRCSAALINKMNERESKTEGWRRKGWRWKCVRQLVSSIMRFLLCGRALFGTWSFKNSWTKWNYC